MAEVKIDIPGIGEVTAQNAASEQTLRELLKVMSTPGTGGTSQKTVDTQKKYNEAKEEGTSALGGFTSAVASASSTLANTFMSAVTAVIGASVGLAQELIAGGNELTDFTKYIPIPGMTALSSILDNQVEQFRTLSQTGASFSNNMFEMSVVAGRAAIPQRDFIELLTTQSSALRLFGDTVGSGARSFAGLSKEFRQSSAGKDLMRIGFTTQELNENLVSYNEMMVVTGRRERMSQQELLEGTAKYSKELDGISKLTGKSRKQLEEEMKAKNLDIRRQMAIAEQGQEFGLRLQQASEASPKLEAALLDMADGVANDPLTQQLMANNETFRQSARDIRNMSQEEMNNFIVGVRDDGRKFTKTLDQAGVQAAISAGAPVGELALLTGELGRTRKTSMKSVGDEQSARDANTEAMTLLAETINDLRGTLQADLIESNLFQDVVSGFLSLIPSIDDAREMYDYASNWFQSNILPTLNETWEWLQTDGYQLMKDSFNKIKDWVGPYLNELKGAWDEGGLKGLWDYFIKDAKAWVTEWWNGLSSEDVIAGIAAAFTAIILGPVGLIGGAIVGGIVATFGWENIKKFFEDALEKLDLKEEAEAAWTYVKDWFKGLFGDLINFDITVPDFTQYLPKWLGGEGKSLFGDEPASSSPSPDSAVDTTTSAPDTTSAITPTQNNTEATATTSATNGLNQLNTNMLTLIDLTKKNTAAIKSLNGNLMVG